MSRDAYMSDASVDGIAATVTRMPSAVRKGTNTRLVITLVNKGRLHNCGPGRSRRTSRCSMTSRSSGKD